MDYEYWIRIAIGGARFYWLRRKLAGSRLYAETKTLGSRVGVENEINDVQLRYLKRLPDRRLFDYAHLVLDAKGVPRSHRVRFRLALSALSLYAALRWNRRISREVARTVLGWACAAVLASPGTAWGFCRRNRANLRPSDECISRSMPLRCCCPAPG